MKNTTNNNEKTTINAPIGDKDNVITRFDRIQSVLSDDNYPDDDNVHLSDKLHKAKANMDMVLNGLSYLFNNTAVGDFMRQDDHYAIVNAWIELETLIELREEEHNKIWNIAFHGEYPVNQD